ncbi:MAG: transcriptional regulator [Tistrella sp.]|uniref:XRE family transcriptional regulator n=1 Tax=Tistrella mobilis TaxID=171437 RepID=A0A3B9IRW5_9PROT|nr:XRE family transcriptional regulator [Tistrella sp.]MAD40451.1 transcriptional regulator [Tistrella sp.]MBA73990.1 transcriptional regulator [Tistrella sp.]HAE50053.1 XRE family transcriptional regulator [Tistrella mobilis]|tara:strand:+ start:723 stop:1634 length:912 start_codon:yes stop_codon:yes gene_type:complete
MTTVFIAGSISITRLHEKVQERIAGIVASGLDVIVGDAGGADSSIQACLQDLGATRVTVYCTGKAPRNNVAGWPVHYVQSKARAGSRAFFTAKDRQMARDGDYGLMIWDCKSTGTLSNVLELLGHRKKSLVFVNKTRDFAKIGNPADLEQLLQLMSDSARRLADEKIGLSARLAALGPDRSADDPSPDAAAVAAQTVAAEAPASPLLKDPTGGTAMKLRLLLMSALRDHILQSRLSEPAAARLLGVPLSRISDLMRDKADVFGLDMLVNMATTAGLRVDMRISDRPDQPSGGIPGLGFQDSLL